jgi:heptosyltransferase-2
MATPLIRCVRENFPDARIVAGVRGYAAGVLDACPHIDSIIVCEDKTIGGMLRLAGKIRRERFDKAILLTNSPRAFIPVLFGGAKGIHAYRRNLQKFFVRGPSPLLEKGRVKAIPMTEYYMEICRNMGLGLPKKIKTELFVSKEADAEISALLSENGIAAADKIICINPGAKFGSSKCWPPANFARLVELAHREFSAKIVLISGPGEEKLAAEIVDKTKTPLTHLGKVNLSRLKPLIRRSSLLITNDTGPRHYATAFGVPAVVILGPTDVAYTDYGRDITSFVSANADCSPCHLKACPCDHRCMTSISPEMVLDEMKNKNLM